MVDHAPEQVAEHEAIVNTHARVTTHRALDHNRTRELREAISEELAILRDETFLTVKDDATYLPVSKSDAWDELLVDLEDHGLNDCRERLSSFRERIERPYPSLVHLEFDPKHQIDFAPGQYVRITYDDEAPRVYSIASSPTNDEMAVCLRRVPGGHLTPKLCSDVEEGDDLFIRGPYGDELALREENDRDMVFIATGTGVAPFRSMIRFTFETGLDEYDGTTRDVWLILGTSWKDDLAYREEFHNLANDRENFHFVSTLSRESYLTDWTGETNYVQQVLLTYLVDDVDSEPLPERLRIHLDEEPVLDIDASIDPETAEFYVCGLGSMTNRVRLSSILSVSMTNTSASKATDKRSHSSYSSDHARSSCSDQAAQLFAPVSKPVMSSSSSGDRAPRLSSMIVS